MSSPVFHLSMTRRRWCAWSGTGLMAWALPGCSAFNHVGPNAKAPQETPPPLGSPPRVAVVLGSGGPRGYAHIGVMRVLEDAGIRPDLIVGASVGALLGAFWASGLDAATIDEMSWQGGPLTLFDPSPFADRGWIHGRRLQAYVNDRLAHATIEQLPTRLVIAATRRHDKTPVYFDRGDIGVAVRASSAMPGIVSPVGVMGVEYEDADASVPVPVSVARRLGARFVIAVDVSARRGTTPVQAPAWKKARDEARWQRIEPEVRHADFLFHPDLDYDAGPWPSYFRMARVRGELHASDRLPALLRALSKA